MSKMGSTLLTLDLSPNHHMRKVSDLLDVSCLVPVKCRPSTATKELFLVVEEDGVAADTHILSCFIKFPVFVGEWSFGSRLTGYTVLLG